MLRYARNDGQNGFPYSYNNTLVQNPNTCYFVSGETMDTMTQEQVSGNQPARTVAFMITIGVVGKVMGLLRDSMQARYLGADTAEGIAFAQASQLPRAFLDVMFAAVLAAILVPMFNNQLQTKDKKAALDFAAFFTAGIFFLTIIITVAMIFLARPVYTLVLDAPELTDATRILGVTLLRFMFPLIILSGLTFTFMAVLHSLGEFRIPALLGVLSNGVILLYYPLLFNRFGVYGLAIAFVVGWVAQVVIQVPFLRRHGFRFRVRFSRFKAVWNDGLKQMTKTILPVMAASWILPVNLIINMRASGSLFYGEFGVPAITFAHNLNIVISGVIILNVTNFVFPKLCRQAAANDKEGLGTTAVDTVRVLFFLLLPLSLGIIALSQPLVQFVLGGGAFGERAVEITARALFYFAMGILGFGIQSVLSRACFAQNDGRTPLIAAIIAIAANSVLSFVLAPRIDVAGPALGAAIGISLAAGYMLVALTKKGLLKWQASLLVDLCKMLLLAVLMFGVVFVSRRWLDSNHVLLQLVIPVILGGGLYLGAAFLLGIKEVKDALRARR